MKKKLTQLNQGGERHEKGSALLIALAVVAIMGLLGTAFMRLSVDETDAVKDETLAQRAFYIAQTGAQHALKELSGNTDWDGVENKPYGGGKYSVQVGNPDANKVRTVISKGRIGGLARTVEVKVRHTKVPAFFFCQFGNTKVNLHNDEPDIGGMKVIGHTWSNRRINVHEGSRIRGDMTAIWGIEFGDHGSFGNGNDDHDSTVIRGNLASAEIEIWEDKAQNPGTYVFARHPDPDNGLDTANGDAYTYDTYKKDSLGEYILVKESESVVNQGFVEGSIFEFSDGEPGGELTLVAIDFPLINYDTLRTIAQSEDHYFLSPQSLYTWMRGDPSRYDEAGGDTTFKLHGKVFYVVGTPHSDKVNFDDNFSVKARFDIKACFVPMGGFQVKRRKVDLVRPDSTFPALVTKGMFDTAVWAPIEPDVPIEIKGLIYAEGDGDTDPYDHFGEVHLHHQEEDDQIHVKGAVIADHVHDCVNVTVEYDPTVKWTNWLFEAKDAKLQVVSWRELKRG